jgi:hypothetical protein
MNLASSPVERADPPLFTDGLGERILTADTTTGELLQVLRLRPALTAVPSFEFALRERTARLMNFRHAYYARVRRIDRVQASGTLAIVSDHVEGTRLSEILRVVHARRLQLDINATLCLIRQLVPAVALLHENARDAAHGLIAPERIVVTPHARLVIVEHVAGSAIEQLQFGRERLWQEFRVAMPSSAGIARFDHRADVNGIGIAALSLVLGRPLAADEFPHAIPSLLMQARERSPYGDERPLSNAFRNWLARTLQLDVRRAFASATEAQAALEEALAADSDYVAAPVALEAFLSQYIAAILEPVTPQLTVVPPPAASPHVTPRLQERPAPVVIEPPARPAAAAPAPPPAGPAPAATRQIAPPAAVTAPSGVDELPTLDELIRVSDLKAPSPRVESSRAKAAPPVESSTPRVSTYEALDELIPSRVHEAADLLPVEPAVPVTRRWRLRWSRAVLIAAAAVVLALGGAAALAARFLGGDAVAPEMGMLIVQSSPAGAEVFVDGVARGMTPARVPVAAGSHILELRGRGVPRVIPLEVQAGGQVSQYLEFADTPMTGMLVIHSQPAGAQVTVDGVERGTAPITIEELSPGDHEVVLRNAEGSSKHVVKVLAGTTASLVAPVVGVSGDGPVSGWVKVTAPFTVEIFENGKLLGTTDSDRLMMAAGRHVLTLVNETLKYREQKIVAVAPGKVAAFRIELPKGSVNLNAMPWAEVFIDGKRVGETPIGNLEVPIGPHEIVFRHPQLGEKRHAISVTAAAPVRLSVAMK